MRASTRIILFLLRAERERIRGQEGRARRLAEISEEIGRRIFTL